MNTLTHTEDSLTASLKAKDKEAFGIIYDNYAPALHGIILRIVRSEQSAEDILQETFIKVWRNADFYDASKGRLFTWLVNIARNTAIDHTRSKGYKQELRKENNLPQNESAGTLNTDHIGLKELVDKLKPENKRIIDLVFFQGYTHAEAAEELKMPLGTIKTKVRASVRQLREVFAVIKARD